MLCRYMKDEERMNIREREWVKFINIYVDVWPRKVQG